MKVFFGAAIQGLEEGSDRREVYTHTLNFLKSNGHKICTEHTTGKTREECIAMMNEAVGPLPTTEEKRIPYVRDKMIELVESDIDAAIFELSTPSLGTGVEFAHAYLRPRMGLKRVPILALYQKDYWPNNLSTMIRGLTSDEFSNISIVVYENVDSLSQSLANFLDAID